MERFAKMVSNIIGGSSSKLERALGDSFPEGERYFGLENFGNTCYCNSVLQALYFCQPFREALLHYHSKNKPASEADETLLTSLADLFHQISAQKRKTGVIAPRRFVQRVKKQKELFRGYMHQDAHEFLNFLLNELVDILEKEAKAGKTEAGTILHPSTFTRSTSAPSSALTDAAVATAGASSSSQPANGSSSSDATVDGFRTSSLGSTEARRSNEEAEAASSGREGEGDSGGNNEGDPGHRGTAATGSAVGSAVGSAGGLEASLAGGLVRSLLESRAKEEKNGGGEGNGGGGKPVVVTWVHEIFQGILTNETRCLCCETVTARDETFLDLSLDIEQNSSVTSCLRNFSSTETLNGNDKFYCDECRGLQEAQKRMRIKVPPRVLALHLKRFKYIEQLGRYKKLSYRVVFPLNLKLCNTVDDAPGAEAEYSLFAVIVHVGSGPNHGHYICLVKSHNHWLFFDDENVEIMDESLVQSYFGSSQEFSNNTDHGYFLFYECVQPELLQGKVGGDAGMPSGLGNVNGVGIHNVRSGNGGHSFEKGPLDAGDSNTTSSNNSLASAENSNENASLKNVAVDVA